jgi:hypothetical protein
MRKRKNLIMEQWKRFEEAVLPAEPAVNQVQEMRRAFFAGAQVMINILVHETKDLPEDEGVKILDDCYAEIHDFAAGIQTGKY